MASSPSLVLRDVRPIRQPLAATMTGCGVLELGLVLGDELFDAVEPRGIDVARAVQVEPSLVRPAPRLLDAPALIAEHLRPGTPGQEPELGADFGDLGPLLRHPGLEVRHFQPRQHLPGLDLMALVDAHLPQEPAHLRQISARLAARTRNGPLERSGNGDHRDRGGRHSRHRPGRGAPGSRADHRGKLPGGEVPEQAPAAQADQQRPRRQPAPPNRWLWSRVIPTRMIVRNDT